MKAYLKTTKRQYLEYAELSKDYSNEFHSFLFTFQFTRKFHVNDSPVIFWGSTGLEL